MPDAKWYANWVRMLPAESAPEKMRNLEAADLIESLAAELERVKRERGAAVKDVEELCKNPHSACHYCNSHSEKYVSNDCMDCVNACNWQWRGVREG